MRRTGSVGLLIVMAACSPSLSNDVAPAAAYVLRAEEGERIFGNSFITVSPATTRAVTLTVAVMRTPPNGRSGVHVHDGADQVVFVVRGSGVATYADMRVSIREGDTVYVGRGVWHEFAAGPGGMEALEIFSPAGVEQGFREVDQATRGSARSLTLDELNDIGRKYGDRYQDVGR